MSDASPGMAAHDPRPRRSTARRVLAVAGIALAGAAVSYIAYRLPPPNSSDFDQLWIAARALARHQDPYAAVAASGEAFPLFYPLPAVLLALPVAWLPLDLARAVWAGFGAAMLALAALRYGRGLGAGLLGAGFLNALVLNQWSPLLTAGAVLPWLAVTWIAKPSIGLALFLAYPSRRAAWLGAGLLAVSLAALPGWPAHWLSALRGAFQTSPILQPGGFLLLLALLRWRRAEGRLLAALACVPQTIGLYETVPLFLITRTRWEGYGLAGLSLLAAFIQAWALPRLGQPLPVLLLARWPILLLLVYLPALLLVLRLPAVAPAGPPEAIRGSAMPAGTFGGAVVPGPTAMSVFEPLLAQPLVYRLWQAPFVERKLAPFLAHCDLSRGGRVLDVGCGPGTNARLFAHAEYLGLDLNGAYVQYARRRHRGRFVEADARSFRAGAGDTFDCILVNSFLHHLTTEDVREVLRNLAGLLAEGGAIHILELVLPADPGVPRLLARLDRGESARPAEEWRALFAEQFATEAFEPYVVGALGVPLWHMVYFKGTRPR